MPVPPHKWSRGSYRIFSALLYLLPREFREHFGREMKAVFADQHLDAAADGRLACARFWLETFTGLLITAFREHLDILTADVTYSLRVLRKDPAFLSFSVLILGLGIGASTAAFLAANAVLLRPLPFSSGDRLVQLSQRPNADSVMTPRFSAKEIADIRASKAFESVFEYHEMPFTLLGGREPLRVDTGVVSAHFFRALGVTPLYGRDFLDEDDRKDATPVLILSYQFWAREFRRDPDVVGRRFSMNDHEHVVVGVLPPLPQFPEVVDVYMPTAACPSRSSEQTNTLRDRRMSLVFATLRQDATLDQAREHLRRIAADQQKSYPEFYPGAGHVLSLSPESEDLRRGIRPILIALAAASGLLLLLACFNTAGLMLSRMLARTRDLGIRCALGARNARLVRGYITEGMVLAFLGGAVGLALATWSIGLLVRLTGRFTTLSTQLRLGAEVVGFWLLLTIVVGVFLGIAPAIGIKASSLWGFPFGKPVAIRRSSFMQRALLVSAQLALAVVLLVGSGLSLRTLIHLEHLDGGFESEGITTARFYVMNSDARFFFDKLVERTRALPGVKSVGLTDSVPLSTRSRGGMPLSFRVRGENVTGRSSYLCEVSRDYFRTIGIHVMAGRSFDVSDTPKSPLVAVVNEHLARHYWAGSTPIGKEVTVFKDRDGKDVWVKVVGVVSDVRQTGLDKEPIDELTLSFEQISNSVMSLVVRTSGPLDAVERDVRWIAHDIAKDVAVTDVQRMTEVRSDSLASPRITATFLTIFAILALSITASGISGMMALMVNDRKQEIGIRLALGATPGAVMRAMFAKVAPAMVGGLVIGLAAAAFLSKSMDQIVVGIPVRDALTFATSSLVLAATAVLFAVAPLTNISRLDPSMQLRAE